MFIGTLIKKIITTSLFIFLLVPAICLAQSGSLKGTVYDKSTEEPLVGANVVIKGTSLGAAADFDGNYIIRGIPAGSHTLVISYIGYKQITQEVNIKGNATNELNFHLEAEVLTSDVVEVTAQAQGQLAAINQQLTSNTIKNVISSEKIHELPDDNAAAALSRLPGVSLQNGDQVVIRGVEAKLNQVMVNGIALPSTDMNNRSTGLGFISSNLLSGIEVIKAITPDMDANTIGGVVNLRLREAPTGLHFDFLSQGNYNYSDRVSDNFKFWASLSNRFFDNKFGVFVQGSADRSNVGDQYVNTNWGFLGRGSRVPGEATYEMNNATLESQASININNGGSLILDYVLPNGKIVFQNTYAHTLTDNRNYINQMSFDSDEILYTMYRDNYGRDLWVNALQLENMFGDIKVEASLSHAFTNKYTRHRYGDGGSFFQFQDESSLQDPWGNGVKYANNRPLHLRDVFPIYDNINTADVDSAVLGGWVTARREEFFQHVYNAAADATIPYTLSKDLTATFKVGGKYTRTTRDSDIESLFSGATDGDTYSTVRNFFPWKVLGPGANQRLRFTDVMNLDYKRGEYYLEDEYDFKDGFKYAFNADLMDDWFDAAMPGWQPKEKWNDTWRDDFDGAEQFTAGYFMGTFDLFAKLTLIAGLRYENYNMKYNANFVVETHSVYGDAVQADTLNHVDRSDENFFPNVQLRYKINNWSDIRAAYTTGIARPDYAAILPKTFLGQNGNLSVGNTKLRPTTSNNLDLNISFYNNEIGLFTVGGFYKELKDVFYRGTLYYANIDQFDISVPNEQFFKDMNYKVPAKYSEVQAYLNNDNPGYVRGFEVDWQTTFWYLPFPLNSVVFNANYTKSWSEMDYKRIINRQIASGTPPRVTYEYISVDTIFTARLPQQAEDVVNLALGIDYKGFSGRLSFNMRGNVITGISVSGRTEENEYTGNIYRWDFTIKQNLPIEGLSIAFNGVNIFHNPVYVYRKFRLAPDLPITENIKNIRYSPTIFQFNVRYGL